MKKVGNGKNLEEDLENYMYRVEKVENNDCDIYGFGFNNFEMREKQLDEVTITNSNKINYRNMCKISAEWKGRFYVNYFYLSRPLCTGHRRNG